MKRGTEIGTLDLGDQVEMGDEHKFVVFHKTDTAVFLVNLCDDVAAPTCNHGYMRVWQEIPTWEVYTSIVTRCPA